MRINNNIMALNAHRNLGVNTSKQTKSLEKLSSGLRINRAADDAAGLSISEKMRSQIRGLKQASKNAQDGISFLQTAEGAMDEVSSMLVRLKELAVQKATGTYDADDKKSVKLEANELLTQIKDIVVNTDFNGKNIKDKIDVVVTDDDQSTVEIGLADGVVEMDGANLKADSTNKLNVLLKKIATDGTGGDVTTAEVEAAITHINTVRSTFGAQQNRLESTVNNLNTTVQNLTDSESRIRDTDMAEEMASYTKNNILVQAATAMLAQANQAPQSVLSLLQ